MAVYKEEKTNTWRAVFRYTDWNGERKQTQKRGFKTKREAQTWEREQLNKTSADLDMTFKSFVDLYTADMKTRLRRLCLVRDGNAGRHLCCPKSYDFNPPTPCGVGLMGSRFSSSETRFQSTHPVWGGTFKEDITMAIKKISIHPPRVGWDFVCPEVIAREPI